MITTKTDPVIMKVVMTTKSSAKHCNHINVFVAYNRPIITRPWVKKKSVSQYMENASCFSDGLGVYSEAI
jgi:hypothetical protein